MQEGKDCAQGLRLRHHYMLCGALLRVWGRIAAVMADVTSSSYLQIVRLKTKDKKKQVGERWAQAGWGRGVSRREGGAAPRPAPRALTAGPAPTPQASRSPRPVCAASCRSCSSWTPM